MLYKIKLILSHPCGLPRLRRGIKHLMYDLQYGHRYLGGKVTNGDPVRGWVSSQNSDYDALSKLFSEVSIRGNDVIVDVGCGKGRVFNYLLSLGVKNKLIGIDVDQDIAEFTRKRLCKYPQVEILNGDIENENLLHLDSTIFYLFNPFVERIIQKFANHVEEKIKEGHFLNKKNRPLIIYYNCTPGLAVFEKNPIWKIKKLGPLCHTQLPAAIIEPSYTDHR